MISAQLGPDTLQQLRRELSANGENAAVIAFTGEAEETWSFAKLGDVSTRLAAGLMRRGISISASERNQDVAAWMPSRSSRSSDPRYPVAISRSISLGPM